MRIALPAMVTDVWAGGLSCANRGTAVSSAATNPNRTAGTTRSPPTCRISTCSRGCLCPRGECLRRERERGRQSADGGERQPKARNGAIAGDVDQVGADGRRKSAEDGGGKAVGQREAGGAHFNRHNLRQENRHRSVVSGVEKRKPKLHDQQARERRGAHQPQTARDKR